jgi:hypothetical protein
MSLPPPRLPTVFRPSFNAIREGTTCSLHPTVQATLKCMCCDSYMCPTCDFALKGGIHVCPTCAMSSAVQGLGSRRKRNVIWGYVLASIATICLAALMSGLMAEFFIGMNETVVGLVFSLFTFVPAAIGFGASSSACERHLPNPMSIKGAIIWNGLLLAAFMALTIIGNLS